jgi:hypothetical protein
MKTKRQNTEHTICREIVKWARMFERRYPCLQWLRHWPNEGKRNPWLAKQIGIQAGPSDYFLPVPTARFHGLWLEIKAKGNKPTEAQERWLRDMSDLGYRCEWCDSIQSAIMILEDYAKEASKHWKGILK